MAIFSTQIEVSFEFEAPNVTEACEKADELRDTLESEAYAALPETYQTAEVIGTEHAL